MSKTFRFDAGNYEVTIGKFAGQADGAAWIKKGGTVVLSTVVSAPSKDFPGFLPLTVDYREQFSAGGKIPGGYFKREGKFTDREVLTGRLIDRAIRPLFPAGYFKQIQAASTVYSVDKEHMPYSLAFLATSIALTISKVPLLEPVGVVEVGRIDGKWVYDPTYAQAQASKVRIIVAGTKDGICMVEGNADEISEAEFLDVMFTAHETIKKQVAWQEEIRASVGVPKEQADNAFDFDAWLKEAHSFVTLEKAQGAFIGDKVARNEYIEKLEEAFIAAHQAKIDAEEIKESVLNYVFDVALQERMTDAIFTLNKRVDGRDYTTVRPITTEVGLLPYTHGSAMFKRGRTQALVTATLGSSQDAQMVDELMGEKPSERSFMLHYNFPSFAAGEVRPNRGPGRREIGHGFLAASAIKGVLPQGEKFPYTIRIVADILESDGSTSMATVCGSIMSLMNAGVPITKMVSGVAMGLVKSSDGKFQALTDISAVEDAFGLMDFKVTGTDNGITAIQMDIKHKGGLDRKVFESALSQAKAGRGHILGEMRKVMAKPNEKLSDLVPQFVSFKVAQDKIGAIIGTGGKVIREIIDKTSTQIDIEDDGTVKIFGHPGPKFEQAVAWVKTIGGLIEIGAIYNGRVRRLAEFGIFVELAPGTDGLVHISMIPREKQRTMEKDYPIDSELKVEVMDYDESTGRIRLRIAQ